MIRTLSRHGNSYALVIEKSILELLGITLDTPLEVTTDGKSLKIEPKVRIATPEEVEEALATVVKRHGPIFAALDRE
jgi:antitoxin component of MazEF toxin-antitoxin module